MVQQVMRRIVALVLQAQELASTIGIPNLMQPGLVKEMIIAEHLGHRLIASKRNADACDPNAPSVKYEYLSCKEGGSGQLDRMFKEPPEKCAESLVRITRNRRLYSAVFYAENQLKVKETYELEPQVVLAEAERQLDRSRNVISHLGFSINWAKTNGKLVYENNSRSAPSEIHPCPSLPFAVP